MNIYEPLEIQQLGIPKIFQGSNVLLAAETGCGKTMAYLLPLATKILKWKQNTQRNTNSPLGLIVTPSRELAVQIGVCNNNNNNNLILQFHLSFHIFIVTSIMFKKYISFALSWSSLHYLKISALKQK